MRVKIVEFGEADSFHGKVYAPIGEIGTLATEDIADGFAEGRFYPDSGGLYYYFLQVKTKPIYDA